MTRSKIKPAIPEHHPIAKAVAPLRAAAVAITTQRAEAFLAKMKVKIDAETDIRKLAPYPNSLKMSRNAYFAARAYYGLVVQLTETAPRKIGEEYTYVWSAEGAAEYLAEQIAHAEHNYVAYVLKLISKVEGEGAVAASASVTGTDDAWTQSTLTVQLAGGTTQNWSTKQIWNTSVYGKIFAQYPTRLAKAKK